MENLIGQTVIVNEYNNRLKKLGNKYICTICKKNYHLKKKNKKNKAGFGHKPLCVIKSIPFKIIHHVTFHPPEEYEEQEKKIITFNRNFVKKKWMKMNFQF